MDSAEKTAALVSARGAWAVSAPVLSLGVSGGGESERREVEEENVERVFKAIGTAIVYYVADPAERNKRGMEYLLEEIKTNGIRIDAVHVEDVDEGHVPPRHWIGSLVWGCDEEITLGEVLRRYSETEAKKREEADRREYERLRLKFERRP